MRKYEQIGRLLKTRVHHGDYFLNEVPPERALAVEMGVSYMTARRAVQALIDEGCLIRKSNGRVAVNPTVSTDEKSGQIAVIMFGPMSSITLARELNLAAQKEGARLRSVLVHHLDDPTVVNAVNRFHGSFLIPSSVPVQTSEQVLNKLRSARRPVVILDADWSDIGFPSIQPFPPVAINTAMEYFATIGAKKIDCLNVQPIDATGLLRIGQWQAWQQQHGGQGELFNLNFQGMIFEMAHAFMKSRLEDGYRPEAILCITTPCSHRCVARAVRLWDGAWQRCFPDLR